MQVIGHTGAGALPEVQADIETMPKANSDRFDHSLWASNEFPVAEQFYSGAIGATILARTLNSRNQSVFKLAPDLVN